jgi:thioredoxin 2
MHATTPEPGEPLQLPCPACGALNRIPAARLAEAPRCGRCRAALLPGQPIAVTDASFERQVQRSPLPVLLDLWAPWCGPCRAMEPVLAQLARRHATRLKVVKVNVDENPALARRFAVRSIPSLRLLRGAHELDRIDGAVSEQIIEQRVARVLG